MDRFIQGLLAYSRAGGETRQVEQVDSAALIREMLSTQEVPEEFHIQIAEPMPRLVTDRTKLQQVFANLLGNALKYHDRPDGHIRVSARAVGDFYEFSVADDGPGIPPEDQTRVFQMFQRGPTALGRTGTGIGLAVVKKLIEGVGGTIDLESASAKAPPSVSLGRSTWKRKTSKRFPSR